MESGTFTRQNQVALLGIPGKGLSVYGYGAITLYGITFQRLSPSPTRPNPGPHTTFPQRSPLRIRFGLFRFRSPLVTESRLFSFPALIRMLWLSAFPLPNGSDGLYIDPPRRLIWASPDQRLLATTRSLSQLVTPFVSFRAEISPKQRGRIEL